MLKQDNYEVNDIVLLNDKEYCIIKVYKKYIVAIANFLPFEILVGFIDNGKFVKETNKEIIKEILLKE